MSFEGSVRFLVEQYYDVQKLRVEAFNRIVAYVGSHSEIEIPIQNASQTEPENQGQYASHIEYENQ